MRCTVTATNVHAADGSTALATLLRNRHERRARHPHAGAWRARGGRAIRRAATTPRSCADRAGPGVHRVAGLDAGADDYLASSSRSRNCDLGCARCCGAAARAPTCSSSPVSSSMSQHTSKSPRSTLPLTKTESRCSNVPAPPAAFPPRYSNRVVYFALNLTRCVYVSYLRRKRGIRIPPPTDRRGQRRWAGIPRYLPYIYTALPRHARPCPSRLGLAIVRRSPTCTAAPSSQFRCAGVNPHQRPRSSLSARRSPLHCTDALCCTLAGPPRLPPGRRK